MNSRGWSSVIGTQPTDHGETLANREAVAPSCRHVHLHPNLYHIVFATKHREAALDKPHRDDLYRFMWGCLEERHCHLYRIGGIEDHVHILTALQPTVPLSELIKELKTASSAWIKGQGIFPRFTHWQDGYGAFTHAIHQRHALIEYIRNQEAHHEKTTSLEEYQTLVEEAGLNGMQRICREVRVHWARQQRDGPTASRLWEFIRGTTG